MLHLSPFITGYIVFISALFGLAMGSFLTCLAMRLAKGESVLHGRSRCDECGHELTARDLVPVFSWLFSKGRCRYCAAKLSAKYVVTELLCAVIYVSVVLRYDVSITALMQLILLSLLFAASLVDIEIQEIPDGLLITGAVCFLPLAFLSGGWPLILRGLIGASALFIPMLLLVLLFDKLMGRETMGGGDLKLIALLGLYFGWKLGLLLILISCFFGLVFAAILGRLKAKTAVPFGPSLSAAAWFTALFGQHILDWYLTLF